MSLSTASIELVAKTAIFATASRGMSIDAFVDELLTKPEMGFASERLTRGEFLALALVFERQFYLREDLITKHFIVTANDNIIHFHILPGSTYSRFNAMLGAMERASKAQEEKTVLASRINATTYSGVEGVVFDCFCSLVPSGYELLFESIANSLGQKFILKRLPVQQCVRKRGGLAVGEMERDYQRSYGAAQIGTHVSLLSDSPSKTVPTVLSDNTPCGAPYSLKLLRDIVLACQPIDTTVEAPLIR